MADQLGLFSGPQPKAPPCRCIVRAFPTARAMVGCHHDRGCPAYEAPPAEMMLLELGRDNLAWVLRHWTGERPPRAEDFTG